MTLGFTWYTFIIFSPELWRTATFKSPHQPNYWDFKGLHSLPWAQSDGFDHIQVENGFGLWQHFHQSDPPGAVWVSGCGEFLARHRGRGILPGQSSPHGFVASPLFLTSCPLACSCWTAEGHTGLDAALREMGAASQAMKPSRGLRAAHRLPASCKICSEPYVYFMSYLPWFNRGAKTVKLLFDFGKWEGISDSCSCFFINFTLILKNKTFFPKV